MNGLFGNFSGINTGTAPQSPFSAGMGNGASTWQWGTPAPLPSHMVTTGADILGGGAPPVPSQGPPSPVNDQRNAITQTLANLTMPAAAAAPATPATPATSAGPPAGGQSMASVTLPQQSGPLPDYSGQAARLSTQFGNMGVGDALSRPHNLDPMGGGPMPTDFQRGPAVAAGGGGGAGK